jgi:cell division protein FtsL
MDKVVKPILFGQFVVYGLSLLITPVSFEKGIVLAILGGLLVFFEHKTGKKEADSLKQEIESLKSAIEEQKKFSQELSSHVSSIKVGQQIKSVGRF